MNPIPLTPQQKRDNLELYAKLTKTKIYLQRAEKHLASVRHGVHSALAYSFVYNGLLEVQRWLEELEVETP